MIVSTGFSNAKLQLIWTWPLFSSWTTSLFWSWLTSIFTHLRFSVCVCSKFYGNTGALWLFNVAMENGPFIDGLPNLKMVIFHGYVK